MNKSYGICVAVIIVFLSSCDLRNSSREPIGLFEGYWHFDNDNGTQVEYWGKHSDDGFTGSSFTIKGNDTTITELLTLVYENDRLYYIPTVFGQNENKPVKFTLTSFKEDCFTFENNLHDFPNMITYCFKGDSIMTATVSGGTGTAKRSFTIPYKRQKTRQ